MSENKEATGGERELSEGAKIVTRELLENALRQGEGRDDITVQDFTVSWATKPGDNMASSVFRIKVTSRDGSAESEHHLILKTIKDNKEMNEVTRKAKIYRKEVGAYTEVMPALVKFQEELGVEPIIPALPKFYHGQDYLEGEPGVVILEDLSPKGYKMGDIKKGLGLEHSKLALKALARIHALSLAMKNRNPENLKQRFEFVFSEAHIGSAFGPMIGQLMKPCIEKVVSVVKSSNAADDVKRRAAKLLEMVEMEDPVKAMRSVIQPVEPFAVVCHGDPWCNNMLFKHEQQNGEEVPVDVKLLDLQILRYAPPTTDLAYFLFISTTSDMRKEHLKDLLKLYHATFMGVLEKVKFECPEFTFEVLEEMFKKTAIFGVLMACMALPFLEAGPEIHEKMDKLAPDDVAGQMGEINDKALASANSKFVNQKLVGLVEDAVALGVI